MEWDIAVAGILVGFVIGLTGMGGGALMTPILVLVFGVQPSAAISSDVVASFFLKPVGGGVHARRGTVNWRMVRWLCLGSVPAAFAGSYVITRLAGDGLEDAIERLLGAMLLIAGTATLVKVVVQVRRRIVHDALMDPASVRPLPTVAIGVLGGFVVGLTSVGSGSLMIVCLMLLYPALSSREMVGTDLVQAVPLVGAAALGHVLFGEFSVGLTTSVLVGAVPGVFAGAHVSSRAGDHYIRPVLVALLIVIGLKLLGVPDPGLLAGTVIAVTALATWFTLGVRRRVPDDVLTAADSADVVT